MRIDVLTIFPNMVSDYCNESILKRAQQKKLLDLRVHNIRDYATDKHHTTDDKPYGGGPGMLMKVEPIDRALRKVAGRTLPPRTKKKQVILLSPQGQFLTQAKARELAQLDQLILVSGRYEGFDERIRSLVNQQISIGPYVLTGGELGAMVVIDAVTRLLPGVLGDDASSVDETFSHSPDQIEYPQYTRPEVYKGKRVPKELLTGNHADIAAWRKKQYRKHPSSI
ncbi:MAG: tRNA (guanosine(37)-N1)-methyltransferase TrmD [Candidatus Nomurabacteria bacterium]|nr:MAG: tRNA (guanosine(37)-N1)-methyltransferase TrmD [Candidatus Nomurabacteria bacterium]